jgi:hypothetical protein
LSKALSRANHHQNKSCDQLFLHSLDVLRVDLARQ